LFGRRVAFGADHRAFLPDLKTLGDAEVNQAHILVLVNHHVRGFHVAKDDWLRLVRVNVGEHVA